MRLVSIVIAASALVSAVSAETWSAQCSYWQLSGASYEGSCSITNTTDADGKYVETVTAGEVTIRLVETARQGVWSTYMIDGQPGVRFEHNRESYSYSTLALDMTLDVSR